jgi:DNA polymerase III delta subunit
VLHFCERRFGMPAKHPRIMTVVDEELAQWLRRRSESEGQSVSLVVREILARQYAEDEERFWAKEGEERLATFNRKTAISHEDAWS